MFLHSESLQLFFASWLVGLVGIAACIALRALAIAFCVLVPSFFFSYSFPRLRITPPFSGFLASPRSGQDGTWKKNGLLFV